MTDFEAVRERLTQMRALCEAATPGPWEVWAMEVRADPVGDSNLDTSLPVAQTFHESGLRTFNADFIAAACPDLMLRLVTEAEGVLNRHFVDVGELCACAYRWPCPDARAVLRAWA